MRSEMSEYTPAKKSIEVSVGESVRIIRELQEMSQNQLARLSGIPQSTISAIENDRINLGVERAKTLKYVRFVRRRRRDRKTSWS
jgi:transcriptional regulator with XRE-family HTH domain